MLIRMTHRKRMAGFSLIEVMVVVAILVLIAAVAAPSYRAWIQNTKVRTVAESLQNGMQRARSEALSRNTPVQFTLGANSAWTVQCVNAASCTDLTGGVVETRSSQEGSTAETTVNSGGNTVLVFTNLGVRSTVVANQITQVDITATDATKNLRINVGGGGNVRMCDPAFSLPDPKGC